MVNSHERQQFTKVDGKWVYHPKPDKQGDVFRLFENRTGKLIEEILNKEALNEKHIDNS